MSAVPDPVKELEGTISRRRRFAQIPDALVTDKRLSSHAVRVWLRLDWYADESGAPMPSMGRIAVEIGCSQSAARRAFAELVGSGWVIGSQRCYHLADEVTQ